MLLLTMTYKEMYDQLAADKKRVDVRKEYFRPKAIKEFKTETRFPAWRWYEYTSPTTKNKYIIFFYARNKASIESPIINSFAVVFDKNNKRFIIKWGARVYKHTPNSPLVAIRQIRAYSSHFFKRYKERFLKNETLSSNDVVCRYLLWNRNGTPIKMNEKINRRLADYGDKAEYGFQVSDGFCFALTDVQVNESDNEKVEAMLVLYTTFMDKSGLTDTQIAAIKEEDATWLHALQYFNNEAEDGTITLTLEP